VQHDSQHAIPRSSCQLPRNPIQFKGADGESCTGSKRCKYALKPKADKHVYDRKKQRHNCRHD
jgi:hypothetical protein